MNIVDTHCHLYNETFRRSIDNWLKKWNNVRAIIVTAMDLAESQNIIDFCGDIKIAHPAVGIHPWNVKDNNIFNDLDTISELVKKVDVIGEIGLDYHFVNDNSLFSLQRQVFKEFLEFAEINDCPTTIHTTGAEDDVLSIIRTFDIKSNLISIHWYSGPDDVLKSLIDYGVYFSIGPAVSYSKHSKVAELVHDDRILTESDGDVKYRGKLGHPGMIDEVIKEIAGIRNQDFYQVSEQIFHNFQSFTGLKDIGL